MGTGLPLLASREGNLGDWTAEANMGLAVPLDNQRLYELLRQILCLSEADYYRFSDNAWNFARTTSWTDVAKRVINGYSASLN
jgi:hypothetical protein